MVFRNLAVRAEPYSHRMPLNQIGGGLVIRAFDMGGHRVNVGTRLTREQVLSINPANRSSLVGRFIDVWPQPDSAGSPPPQPVKAGQAERHVMSLGFNRFHVIEGVQLTDEPVDRAEAYALAGKTEPPKRGMKEH
jgi:hypothetical protein